jgi:hypothetical protein
VSNAQSTLSDGTVIEDLHIRIPISLGDMLRRHAFERRVRSVNRFVVDALIVLMHVITPEDHPSFRPEITGVEWPPLPSDVPPGYLRSLGWAPEEQEHVS